MSCILSSGTEYFLSTVIDNKHINIPSFRPYYIFFLFLPLVIKSIGHDFVVFKCIDFRKVDDFDLFN